MFSLKYPAFLVSLALGGASGWAQNDECPGAIALGEGLHGPFDNATATQSMPWTCGAGPGYDLWYAFTAPSDGQVTIETCGGPTNFDTRLEVFDGACGSLISLACNDDACYVYSRVTFGAVAGTTYPLRVGGYNGTRGTFQLRIDHVPTNDECAGALLLADGANGPFTNATASESSPMWPCGAGPARDVWFQYTATCSGAVTFATCATAAFDTRLEVFDGLCGALNSLACNDDACGLQSSVTVASTVGQTFLVRVAGFSGASGSFGIDVTCTTPPSNDECTTAIAIVDGPNGPFSNVLGTDSPEAWSCGGGPSSADVWFTYTASCDGDLTFDTCANSNFDTRLEVYEGVCGALNSIGCNDDSCGLQSAVTIPAIAGMTYVVRVGGFNGASGSFDLTATCSVPNDDCGGAIPVFDSDFNIAILRNGPFSNQGASTSAEPFGCGLMPGADVWFSYVATCTGTLSVETCNTSHALDTVVELFRGSCGSLTSIGCSDDACGTQSDAQAAVTQGETIYVRVAGAMGAMGTFDLLLSYKNGTGAFATLATGCGPAQIVHSGAPNLGGTVHYSITGGQGVNTFLIFGTTFLGANGIPLCPPASCALGTDLGIIFNHNQTVDFAWPCDPNFIGFQFYMQGIDFGAAGGCDLGGGLMFTTTDTVETTVGA